MAGGSPGPMERTRSEVVTLAADDLLRRLAERGGVPLRRRGWQRDRVVPTDGASDEQDGASGFAALAQAIADVDRHDENRDAVAVRDGGNDQ
jgi:hypothetical protein